MRMVRSHEICKIMVIRLLNQDDLHIMYNIYEQYTHLCIMWQNFMMRTTPMWDKWKHFSFFSRKAPKLLSYPDFLIHKQSSNKLYIFLTGVHNNLSSVHQIMLPWIHYRSWIWTGMLNGHWVLRQDFLVDMIGPNHRYCGYAWIPLAFSHLSGKRSGQAQILRRQKNYLWLYRRS